MTKNEKKKIIYDELERLGHKPAKAVNFCKLEDLEAELEKVKTAANLPEEETEEDEDILGKAFAVPEPEVIPKLHFQDSGWCETLKTSYFQGIYRPRTWAEYEALKPFAKEV